MEKQHTGAIESVRPQRWVACLLVAATLASIGVAAFGVRSHQRSRVAMSVGLEVPEEFLDLGTVWHPTNFPWKLPVTNTSAGPIEIGGLGASCGCVSITPNSMTIEPGKVGTFDLRLDLTPKGPNAAAEASYPFSIQLVPLLRHVPSGYVVWNLRGTVRRAIELSTPFLDFDESLVSGSSFKAKTFGVRCLLDDVGLSAECDPIMATVRVEPAVGEHWDYDVEVLPKADLPAGKHTIVVHLRLVPEDKGEPFVDLKEIPVIPVSVSAEVFGQVRATPKRVYLGGGRVGDVLTETITLSSAGVPFVVSGAECTPEQSLTVQPFDAGRKDDDTQKVLLLSQRIAHLGIQNGQVRFSVVREGTSKQETVQVSVSYVGHETDTDN